jgi:hypothetical protein
MDTSTTIHEPTAQAPTTTPRLAIEVAALYPSQGQWTEADYLHIPVACSSLKHCSGGTPGSWYE